MPRDPHYTILGASSKLMFLGISGRFRGLSTVFGSREDFDAP